MRWHRGWRRGVDEISWCSSNLPPHHQRSRVPCQRVGVDGRCVTATPFVRPSLLLFAAWGPLWKQEQISHAAPQTLLPGTAPGAFRVRYSNWVEGSFAVSYRPGRSGIIDNRRHGCLGRPKEPQTQCVGSSWGLKIVNENIVREAESKASVRRAR